MRENTRIQIAVALTAGRLHQAVGDKRCGCGPCAHQVAMAARRAGVRREQLEAALPPAARPEPRQRRNQRTRRNSTVRLSEACTLRVRGGDIDPQEGMALLQERLHRTS